MLNIKVLVMALGLVMAQDCQIQVPAAPLTATGLSTPYILGGANCLQSIQATATFVEATIYDTATGAIAVYHPLVISQGTMPAANPVPVNLTGTSVVGIWFGTNADSITLTGDGVNACVNGLEGSIFGQFAYCNAAAFFKAVNKGIKNKLLTVPTLGVGLDGNPCPTTRDFRVVDQDQSDNLNTAYLLLPDGRTAQKNVENIAAFPAAKVIDNGSDNRLLVSFMAPVLGCNTYTAPSLDDPNGPDANSLALNEIQAAMFQRRPIAIIPSNNPMVKVDDKVSLEKLNLYRTGVNMKTAEKLDKNDGFKYCTLMINFGLFEVNDAKDIFVQGASPVPATANSLFTFLAARSNDAVGPDNLGCLEILNINQPWNFTIDAATGIITDAVFVGNRFKGKPNKRFLQRRRGQHF